METFKIDERNCKKVLQFYRGPRATAQEVVQARIQIPDGSFFGAVRCAGTVTVNDQDKTTTGFTMYQFELYGIPLMPFEPSDFTITQTSGLADKTETGGLGSTITKPRAMRQVARLQFGYHFEDMGVLSFDIGAKAEVGRLIVIQSTASPDGFDLSKCQHQVTTVAEFWCVND